MKKLLSILFVLCISLSLIGGCSDTADTNSSSSTVDDGIFSKTTIKYANEDGSAKYTLIRDVGISTDAASAVQKLFLTIKKVTNVTGFKSSVDENVEPSSETFEILIGQTNREESEKASQYLASLNGARADDFIIATVGNKIVINAFTDKAIATAIAYFEQNYVKEIEGGILYTSLTKGNYKTVTVNGASLGYFKIIRPTVNFSYVTSMQIDKLCTALEEYAYAPQTTLDNTGYAFDYEIIVGSANRDGVETVKDADTYSIKILGKKVYLNGGSNEAVNVAIAEFQKLLEKGTLTDADSVTGSSKTAIAGYDASKQYTRVWGDDFNGADREIDKTLWYTVPEGEYSSKGYNKRTSIRTNDTSYVYVSDGKFHINCAYDDTRYIGGMLMTDRTMLFKYGFLEMSAILPNGNGLWTSMWLDSRWHGVDKTDSGINYDMEIDINECFGKANVVAANCHAWPTDLGEAEGYEHLSLDANYSNDKKHYAAEGTTFNDGFHTYGMLWDEDEFSFTCDGDIYFTWQNNTTMEDLDAFHQLCYIRLSAAVGLERNNLKIVADDSDVWRTTNQFIVDYVHLYQLADGKQQIVLRNGTLED